MKRLIWNNVGCAVGRLAGIAIIALLASGCSILYRFAESKYLATGPNGPQTPQSVGVSYERVRISSDDRLLDAYLVEASPECSPRLALLIFHGAGETISDWVKAQRVLYDNGISSLVFDYSGHGNSSGPGSTSNLNNDVVSAYGYFASRFSDRRRCILGFSMGNAPMLASIARLHPAPSQVVVASAFSSLRELGKSQTSFFPRILAGILPDVWNNVKAVSSNRAPLLVLHSDSDAASPLRMAEEIYEAAQAPKRLVVLHDFKHNAPLTDSTGRWWKPIIAFLKEDSVRAMQEEN